MARVIPFKGTLYNKGKIGDFSRVVAPPYDVISEEEKEKLRNRHPENVVRLILCPPGEKSGENLSFYNSSATCFRKWLADGTLKTDDEPAIYLTSIEFSIEGTRYQRYAFIAYVRLEPFENKVVLPHERTSSKVKDDRLNLLKATHANFCQIFSLYTDPEQVVVNTLVDAVAGKEPDIDLVDDVEERHRLWRIIDPEVTGRVTDLLADKRLYIADGHHRYETALNYRAWVAKNDPDFSDDHPANFIMMSLTSTSDPGLVVLPTHRLLLKSTPALSSDWLQQAKKLFDIEEIPFEPADRKNAEKQFQDQLRAHMMQNTIGAVLNGRSVFYLLTLRPEAAASAFDSTVPEVLRTLDVTLLTEIVLKKLLGYKQSELDEEEVIDYTSRFEKAIDQALSGKCEAAFLMNPTRNEQVQDVAAQGEIMPRKSTFYYPKVLTGLVFSDKKQAVG